MKAKRPPTRTVLIAASVVFTLFCGLAHSTENADISALLQARQYDVALARSTERLKTNPSDPHMRFLRAVALTSLGRKTEAVAVFSALTEDFPGLAEPWNNLAVIHAGAGHYHEALAALSKAILADPKYATAYENQADLYVQLADQAYAKAIELNPSSSTARQRHAALRRVKEGGASVAALPSGADLAPLPMATRTATPTNKVEATAANDKQAILRQVQAWAAAWSARDVTAYLSYYATEFRTPKHLPRSAWEAKRRLLIEGKARIHVAVDSPQVNVTGQTATVRFQQRYVSDHFRSNERKTLILQRYDENWRIVEERSGE